MGFQFHKNANSQRLRNGYKKLADYNDEKANPAPRKRVVVKKMNGRIKGLRLARARRFTLRALTVIFMPKRIAALCSETISRLLIEGACPSIVFSTQWGLPVLSHSSFVRCY